MSCSLIFIKQVSIEYWYSKHSVLVQWTVKRARAIFSQIGSPKWYKIYSKKMNELIVQATTNYKKAIDSCYLLIVHCDF
ncbi:hypothetical protein EUGRSUZ_C03477 [Eucalyptus grandis]|uniref:Uncharacterized protein n=2 Tax=Eucalyptus grandis TaxID=71139 RepID=A0ACC3LKS5_EUCGR|nr:hypothetical protein EUGRSUZ_C03477 [Eucalyptus grandis]